MLNHMLPFGVFVPQVTIRLKFPSYLDINQVLSMSRLGGAGAVAQLVADVPPSSAEVR